MIETQDLTRHYGQLRAVDGLTFRAEPGQVVGLLGPNGAGKSTAMRMISGFLAPTSGRAWISGFDVTRQPLAARRALGYLPEGAPAYADLTVREFLLFVARVRGLKGDTARDCVAGVSDKLQLDEVMHRLIGVLSKGFRRRLGMAQAILHDPSALMLDEPTDGLDPNQKQQVRALIDTLARDRTILISTHLLEEVRALCDRVLILAHGRLMLDSTPAELEKRSRHHGAVSFTATGSGVARSMLERLDGVAAVEVDAHSGRMTVFPEAGCHVLEPVQALLNEQGLTVSELQLEKGRLDEVFRDVTRQSEPAA